MERCPNCRARFKEDQQATCRRCGMQLTGLWALEDAVAQLDKAAATVMLAGDMQQARILLEQRLRLQWDTFSQLLLTFTTEQAEAQRVYAPLEIIPK